MNQPTSAGHPTVTRAIVKRRPPGALDVKADQASRGPTDSSLSWSERYGPRHRLVRVQEFPAGIAPPRKVRVYWRLDHWVLQWWEPSHRQNLSERVEGDLVAVVARAREIDARLLDFKCSGRTGRKLRHHELVGRFVDDLSRRADAGDLDPASVRRYRGALAHYLAFTETAEARKWPLALRIDREFAMAFAAFLSRRRVAPNGGGGCRSANGHLNKRHVAERHLAQGYPSQGDPADQGHPGRGGPINGRPARGGFAQGDPSVHSADGKRCPRAPQIAPLARRVEPGITSAAGRPMKGCGFVYDAARAMFQWAADPQRGNLLPDGFRNPLLGRTSQFGSRAVDPWGQPDITVSMAVEFLDACDEYQLRLFLPLVFFGLRAAEPLFLFREYVEGPSEEAWLRVPCNPALAYATKGRRDKRFPLPATVRSALLAEPTTGVVTAPHEGLILIRRAVAEGKENPPLRGWSLGRLESELDRRLRSPNASAQAPDANGRDGRRRGLEAIMGAGHDAKAEGGAMGRAMDHATGGVVGGAVGGAAEQRRRIRDRLLWEAGACDYDRLEGEFRSIAGGLGWPACATLKDFRHLFATGAANAGMAEPYRKYLMGHASLFGNQAIGAYTHLDELRQQYELLLHGPFAPFMEVIDRRTSEHRTARGPS